LKHSYKIYKWQLRFVSFFFLVGVIKKYFLVLTCFVWVSYKRYIYSYFIIKISTNNILTII
jgi:hypothetical protein